MRGRIALALAAILYSTSLVATGQVNVPPAAPLRGGNPEAANIRNPVPSSPESAAAGKRVFSRLCVRCHGPLGKGDGGGAGAGGQPSDLTDAAWDFGSSDGEIFSVIHDGTSADMEGYAEQISAADIWNLVNYIRSIGPNTSPDVPQRPYSLKDLLGDLFRCSPACLLFLQESAHLQPHEKADLVAYDRGGTLAGADCLVV